MFISFFATCLPHHQSIFAITKNPNPNKVIEELIFLFVSDVLSWEIEIIFARLNIGWNIFDQYGVYNFFFTNLTASEIVWTTNSVNTVLCFLRMIFVTHSLSQSQLLRMYNPLGQFKISLKSSNFYSSKLLVVNCQQLKFVIFYHGVGHRCYGNCLIIAVPVIDLSTEFGIFSGRNSTFLFRLHIRLLKNLKSRKTWLSTDIVNELLNCWRNKTLWI